MNITLDELKKQLEELEGVPGDAVIKLSPADYPDCELEAIKVAYINGKAVIYLCE